MKRIANLTEMSHVEFRKLLDTLVNEEISFRVNG